MKYRLCAIDLDGTLLSADHSISARNARAVRELTSRGVACVIASGRMHEATTRYSRELGLETPIISYNGAMVKNPVSGEVWSHLRMPAAPAMEVVRYCAQNGFHLNYYHNDHLYVAQRSEWAEFYVRQTGSPMEEIGDLTKLDGSEPTKLILIDTPDTTHRLLDQFRAHYGETLYITTTNPEYLEFMNPAVNKASALELVCARMGVKQSEVIGMGDGNNDLPMIKWAALGVAMGEARDHVKAAADVVAPPCAEDGLAQVLEGLIAAGDI